MITHLGGSLMAISSDPHPPPVRNRGPFSVFPGESKEPAAPRAVTGRY
jgi:hypothetical protein